MLTAARADVAAVPAPAPVQTSPAVPAAVPTSCSQVKAPYRAGLWEITSVSSNSLMAQAVTARIKRCVTERDTQNACGLNQLAGGRNRDCQIGSVSIRGNTATWSMHCSNPHFVASGTGQTTFSDDAYHGKFRMSAITQGSHMEMNTTFTGKRLGNCK
jgi:hypothetical protein